VKNIGNILDQILASVPVFRPELALATAFIACIFMSLFAKKRSGKAAFFVAMAGFLADGCLLLPQAGHPATGFSGMLLVDDLSVYARLLIAIGGMVAAVFVQHRHPQNNGDVHSVLLAAIIGMNLMAMTSHWLTAFIAIEMVSIASYILVGYFSEDKKQSEAAMKYALFGAVCSAVMLYGLSLLYGLTGSLDFRDPAHVQGLADAPRAAVSIAVAFVFAGMGFKLGFVPFHVWSPDVYEGAPTAVTAFLSTLPKVGTTILLTRLCVAWVGGSSYFSGLTSWLLALAAIATMLVGNLAALRQHDAKRLMAYSSIGHTGFLLMAVLAYGSSPGYLLFYLAAYVLMNFAAFLFIARIEQETKSADIRSFAGLGRKMPVLFTAFTLVAVSLVGLPPTMGFFGKLLVFAEVFGHWQSGGDWVFLLLLCTGALTTVISLFFYFKIPLYAFLRRGNADITGRPSVGNLLFVLGLVLTAALLVLGIFPWVLRA